MKSALITGVTGQDGAYLAKLLLEKGYTVYGTFRRLSTPNFWRLQYLNIFNKISLIPIDLSDSGSISEAIMISEPDEIYHLAAQSFVGASFETPVSTGDITGISVTRFLESIRHYNLNSKFYFAATSELFGDLRKNDHDKPISESDPFQPQSPYAAAKLYAFWINNIYKKGYGMYNVNGILFNHESPLRGLEFVTRKISNEVAKIAHGQSKQLTLGNLDAKRDWGYAPEYVEAMWLMLQQSEPDDYIIATGESHSVLDFVQAAFKIAKLDYQNYLSTNKQFYRPLDVPVLKGDYSKAKEKLGWTPKIKFESLVEIMVKADLERWEKWVNGESIPWDAPFYPNELNILTRSKKM